jgi:hypothetical protein
VTDDYEPRTVSLTFSGPEYERLQLEATDEGVAVDEWLKQAARFRIARIDTDLAHSIETDITVELPDNIYERARLRREQANQSGKDNEFADYAWDYINLNPEFVNSDGDPITDCNDS